MLEFDEQKTWANVRRADTDDLLDRVTVYRAGMEPEAVGIIEAELRRRGLTADQIASHARQYDAEVWRDADGLARQCSFCRKPAVHGSWSWHWLWGRLPVFPRFLYFCREHRT